MQKIKISKNAEESVRSGHPWIFSNEVVDRPRGLEAGEIVYVEGRNSLMGVGYINEKSLIMVRLLSRIDEDVNEDFFERRIRDALRRRPAMFGNCFRVVNSESDFLPGIIVDRYEKCLVVQVLTCGMERLKEKILTALKRVFPVVDAIVLRNDNQYRTEEGLPLYVEVVEGSIDGPITARIGELHLLVDLLSGHKTGFYFDQRENRAVLRDLAPGARVLDLFSYTCGFGLHARSWGAKSVTCVDSSEAALRVGQRNMELNGLNGIQFVRQDCFEFLKGTGESYDVIILDPPAFIKSRKKVREGERGYIDLNKRALRRINDDGYLLTFSCSHHMKRPRFRDIVRIAAYGYADLYLIRELSQSADHPVVLSIPETEYLKGLLLRVKKR